jgi:hypothetical protein
MGSEEARLALMIPKTSGPQRPGGNNPVPPIDTLKEQAQIALVMLNTHYNSYVGANNRHHLAIAEMHLRQCIAAQETLRSRVGDAMTITLSQGWSAKYQLSKLKEWMRQHLPQAVNHPVQSFTTTNADQGYHPQATHAKLDVLPAAQYCSRVVPTNAGVQPNEPAGQSRPQVLPSGANAQSDGGSTPSPSFPGTVRARIQPALFPTKDKYQRRLRELQLKRKRAILRPRAGEDDGHGRIPPASFGLYGPQRSFQVGPIQSLLEMKVT